MNKYKCNLCKKVIDRDSEKKWIRSICDETNKTGRLIKIEFNDKLVTKLCREFLPNGIDLTTFNKTETLYLKMAFEQGATVMMNYIK